VKPADRRCADVVTVPDIVGMTVDEGRRLASAAGVVLANPDPDGPPLGALTWPGVWTITHQSPVAGSRLYRWDSVAVRYRAETDGGPAGVREPRRPQPGSGALSAERGLHDAE
jgi:hypothetical protein